MSPLGFVQHGQRFASATERREHPGQRGRSVIVNRRSTLAFEFGAHQLGRLECAIDVAGFVKLARQAQHQREGGMLVAGAAKLLCAELAPRPRALKLADDVEREGDLADEPRPIVIVREIQRTLVRARRIAVGVHRGEAVAGGFVGEDRARHIAGRPEVVRDLVFVGGGIVFEQRRDAAVKAPRLRVQQLAIERLTRDRVAETEGRMRGALDDELHVARAMQRGKNIVFLCIHERGEELGIEVAADHRGSEHRLLFVGRHRSQTLDDAGRDRAGNAAGFGAVPVERAAQQLFGDERVAFGESDDPIALMRIERPRRVRAREQRADIGVGERLQAKVGHAFAHRARELRGARGVA